MSGGRSRRRPRPPAAPEGDAAGPSSAPPRPDPEEGEGEEERPAASVEAAKAAQGAVQAWNSALAAAPLRCLGEDASLKRAPELLVAARLARTPGGHAPPTSTPLPGAAADGIASETRGAAARGGARGAVRGAGLAEGGRAPPVSPPPLVAADEVLLSITVHPGRRTHVTSQRLLMLGSATLTDLRDAITCVADVNLRENLAAAEAPPPEGAPRPGFLFIDGVFYNDVRPDASGAPPLDYSAPILAFAASHRHQLPSSKLPFFGAGQYRAAPMSGVTLASLALRVGAVYVYCHAGCCEHGVTVTDIRQLHGDDPQQRGAYPLLTAAARGRKRKCSVCLLLPAVKVTYGDRQAATEPGFFCDEVSRATQWGGCCRR